MSNRENIFIKKLKEKAVTFLIAGICAGAVGVWDYVERGRSQEKYEKFKADADKLVREELSAPNLLLKIFDSEFVSEFAEEKKDQIEAIIVNQVLQEDSTKVNLQTLLGKETGLRDEVIYPLLADLIKAYNEGKLVTEDQVERMLEERRIRANF